MRSIQPLTLLQRAVLARLDEADCHALAEMARTAWRNGESLPIREPAESLPSSLLVDFARANAQAGETED